MDMRTPQSYPVRVPPGARVPSSQAGLALLAVLTILMVMAGSSASLIWLMNQQQTRAGTRLRSTAALTVAEAGVQRALSIFESDAPDGTLGRAWKPMGFTETVSVGASTGRFTLWRADEPDGAIVLTSAGEIRNTVRRLRVRVYLASPMLLAGLAGRGAITLDGRPTTVHILPYGAGPQHPSWIDIAADRGIEFASKDTAINANSIEMAIAPGPMDPPERGASPILGVARPVRIVLPRGASLTLGPGRVQADIESLRTAGIRIGEIVPYTGRMTAPEVDRAHYERLAAANTDNAGLNKAAGRYTGDAGLAGKGDSLYDWTEFERLTKYLWAERLPGPLRGVIYIKNGGVSLFEGQRLQITEGALIAESAVYLSQGASLEVLHSPATRTLPGIIALDNGAITLTRETVLRVHGLVYATGSVDAGMGARIDVVGSILSADPEFSFRTLGASVVIRYDPAVLGTPGLRVPRRSPVVAWIAAWEELP